MRSHGTEPLREEWLTEAARRNDGNCKLDSATTTGRRYHTKQTGSPQEAVRKSAHRNRPFSASSFHLKSPFPPPLSELKKAKCLFRVPAPGLQSRLNTGINDAMWSQNSGGLPEIMLTRC